MRGMSEEEKARRKTDKSGREKQTYRSPKGY